MTSYVPDDISTLLSMSIENFISTNIVILESDKFIDEALNLMKERNARNARSVLASPRRGRRHREQD